MSLGLGEWLSNICQLSLTRECIPSGPKDLWMLNLPSLSLTLFPINKKSSFLQPSSLSLNIRDYWRPASAAKTEANKAFSNNVFSLSSVTRIWPPFWSGNAHCCLISNFSSTGIPRSFLAGWLSIHSSPSLCWYQGLPQSKCKTLQLMLL